MRIFRLFAALVVAGLIAAACGSDSAVAADTVVDGANVSADAEQPEPANEAQPEPVTEEPLEEESVDEAVVEAVEEGNVELLRTSASREATFGDEFPDIIGAEATHVGAGAWNFSVTVLSPYDTPQRYADAWRVVDPDGNELGIRILAHDHANEQPFTRSQPGIQIPEGVTEVTVQGRDLLNGWGGGELVVPIPS